MTTTPVPTAAASAAAAVATPSSHAAPPAVALVAVSTASSPFSSQEFRHGWAQLVRNVPASAIWVEVPQAGPAALVDAAVQRAAALQLPDSARVLLLTHGHVLLTRGVLAQLGKALDTHPALTAVHAFDSGFAPPLGPDYCTVRGMERYLQALDQSPSDLRDDDGLQTPLVTLTTLGAVRAHQVRSKAAWVPHAFVHDFAGYHQGRREEVLPLLPEGVRRVLDVGGGEGGFLAAVKKARGCETHLAEFSAEACRTAQSQVDCVWPGDFLTQPFAGLPAQGQGAFDCISFLDVLEHAAEPQDWLQRSHALLAPDGVVVASIPNVGHWGVVADLLEGRWDYCPVGIHCVTHLRFFTEHSVHELFAQAGFTVERIDPVRVPCPPAWAQHWAQTPGLQAHPASWDTYAFLVRARPLPGAVRLDHSLHGAAV